MPYVCTAIDPVVGAFPYPVCFLWAWTFVAFRSHQTGGVRAKLNGFCK